MLKFVPYSHHRNSDQKTILSLVPDSNCFGNFLSVIFYLIKLILEGIVVALVCHNFLMRGKSTDKQNCPFEKGLLKMQVPTTHLA